MCALIMTGSIAQLLLHFYKHFHWVRAGILKFVPEGEDLSLCGVDGDGGVLDEAAGAELAVARLEDDVGGPPMATMMNLVTTKRIIVFCPNNDI